MTRWLAVPVVTLALLGVAGCAGDTVTVEEYAVAYERYADCLAEYGTPLIELDMSTPVYDYAVPMSATYLGIDDYCYADFREVDQGWRASQRSTSDSH